MEPILLSSEYDVYHHYAFIVVVVIIIITFSGTNIDGRPGLATSKPRIPLKCHNSSVLGIVPTAQSSSTAFYSESGHFAHLQLHIAHLLLNPLVRK